MGTKLKIIMALTFAVSLVGSVAVISTDEELADYEVVNLCAENGVIDEPSETGELYITSNKPLGQYSDSGLFLYYFREEKDSQDVFMQPVFKDGKCVEEKYFSSEEIIEDNNYSSAEGSPIFETVFYLLNNKTSKDSPAMLFFKKSTLYCLIGKTAYAIYSDIQPVPKTISIGKIRNQENAIVYKVQENGDFEIAS
jgi:hypothetical protein